MAQWPCDPISLSGPHPQTPSRNQDPGARLEHKSVSGWQGRHQRCVLKDRLKPHSLQRGKGSKSEGPHSAWQRGEEGEGSTAVFPHPGLLASSAPWSSEKRVNAEDGTLRQRPPDSYTHAQSI